MPDLLWALAGFGTALAPLIAVTLVRRRRRPHAALVAGCVAPEYQLSPTIEDAERRMAVLLRRMRAHLRDPYDFAISRVAGEAGFEDCLDRAAALGTQIAELGGAAPASQAERERTRGLILEGLMANHRMATAGTIPRLGHTRINNTIGHAPIIPKAHGRARIARLGRGDAASKAGC